MGHCRRKFSTPLHTSEDEAGRKRGSTRIGDAHLQISRSGSTINIDLSALEIYRGFEFHCTYIQRIYSNGNMIITRYNIFARFPSRISKEMESIFERYVKIYLYHLFYRLCRTNSSFHNIKMFII